MNRNKITIGVLTILFVIFTSWAFDALFIFNSDDTSQENSCKALGVDIFKDSKAYNLALAVKKNDISAINEIVSKDDSLVNEVDSVYQISILLLAVKLKKYEAAKVLLEHGADPNLASKSVCVDDVEYSSVTPLYSLLLLSKDDKKLRDNDDFLKLLLKHGANPNWLKIDKSVTLGDVYSTPLVIADYSLSKVKLLVENGADVDFFFPNGQTPVTMMLNSCGDIDDEKMKILKYLIVDKNADVTRSYYAKEIGSGKLVKVEPVDELRKWVFDVKSSKYKAKLAIVDEFKKQGIDYFARPVPDEIKIVLKDKYGKSYEEYLNVY